MNIEVNMTDGLGNYWGAVWDHNYQKLSVYDVRDVRKNTFIVKVDGGDHLLYNWWRGQIGLIKTVKAAVGKRKKMLEDIGVDFNLTLSNIKSNCHKPSVLLRRFI